MVREKEKQHYIPQFYLKAFSPEERGNYVYCYDKENNKSFRTSIRKICYEIGFYENEHKNSKPIEEAFSLAERECRVLFNKVIDAEDLFVLNMSEFSTLLGCLLLFKQRTRKRRDIVKSARERWVKRINDRFSDWKVVPKVDNWERNDHLLSMVETMKEEMKMLCKNNWELITNKTKIPFWTSDDPLIRQLVYNDKRFGKPYVKNYFPLTPKVLMHSEPLLFSSNVRLYKTEITSDNVIKNLNRLTLENAYRFVISKNNEFVC